MTKRWGAVGLGVAAGVWLGVCARAQTPAGGDREAYAVIVHPANTERSLSLQEVREIFTLERRRWADGTPISVWLPPEDSDAFALLLDTVYRTDLRRLHRRWRERVFAGELEAPPPTLPTVEELLRVVAAQPGAVAIVPLDRLGPSVRALRVDGHAPGEPGYPLVRSRSEAHRRRDAESAARFLLRLLRFVRWPEAVAGRQTLPVYVLGHGPIADALARAQGQRVGRRRLEVRTGLDPEAAATAAVVVLAGSERGRLQQRLAALETAQVLTVSAVPGFVDVGGAVGLLPRADRVHFEVDLAALRKHGFDLPTSVLRLADRVVGGPGGRSGR